MKKINILESLKKIDKDTFSEYDLSTLYESNRWSEDQQKQLVKYISSYKDPSFIGQYMADCQDCKNITESDDDDIDDLKFIDMSKEAYLHGGDDYGFDEYDIIDHYDDLEDGYEDEELASGFGGDRNTCPKCGGSNYHDGHCYDCEPDYIPSEIDEASGDFYIGWVKMDMDEFHDYMTSHPELKIYKSGSDYYVATSEHDTYAHQVDNSIVDTLKSDPRFKKLFVESKSSKESGDFYIGFDFGPHLGDGDYELSESFDTELRDKLVRMWFEKNTADWLVKNDPATAEWLAYGGATTNDFAEVEQEVLAKLNGGEDNKEAKWKRLITKPVNDSDGFTTDYSMWYNDGEKRWVFIFGDSDAYDPTNTDPDWETEDPEEARQWFLDYKGFEDTDESLKEDWRTGTFTKDDLPGYRAEMKKRVESVVYSIRAMKRNHPDMADLFDKLTDELVDSLSFLKDESLNEDAEEDELETSDQKISSAATSINSSKLPAIF